MESILLATTIVALIVALVMSVAAARFAREERRRSAARVAALTVASGLSAPDSARVEPEPRKAPWAPAVMATPEPIAVEASHELPLHQGFLHSGAEPRSTSGGQRKLAVAAAVLFVALVSGLVWSMSGAKDTSAAAVPQATPLELVSLRHDRQSSRLSVSGLVRNPVAGRPVEHLSAVVFLFDQQGSFVKSGKAQVDFVTLGAGDETPFVVTLDAPSSVARYRVSFRTDAGIVPHIDRRGAPPIADSPEQPVSVRLK